MNEEMKSNEQVLNGGPSPQSETSRPAPRRRTASQSGMTRRGLPRRVVGDSGQLPRRVRSGT